MEEYDNSIYLDCACDCEVIRFTKESEEMNDKIFIEELKVAISKRIYYDKPSLWNRIKFAWKHLLNGSLYYDCIILPKTNVTKLKEFLNKEFNDDTEE